ncbi:hypothetical protein D9M72_539130 [compost metagenome]
MGPQFRNRNAAGRQVAAEAAHAAKIGERGLEKVHTGVATVGPVHRDLVYAESASFGQDQQFGVKEPCGVGRVRQDVPGNICTDSLEAALRVAETRTHQRMQQKVVAAGDESPPRSADNTRRSCQPRPDRQVRVSGKKRGDQGSERSEVGGKTHVHVGQDG